MHACGPQDRDGSHGSRDAECLGAFSTAGRCSLQECRDGKKYSVRTFTRMWVQWDTFHKDDALKTRGYRGVDMSCPLTCSRMDTLSFEIANIELSSCSGRGVELAGRQLA